MTDFAKIPDTEHFAILTRETIHIPGDERSRTNPGHGYPAENREVVNYEVFTDRTVWEANAANMTKRGEKFRAIHVRPAQIETTVSVKVK